MADFTGGPGLLAFIATFSMVLAAVVLFRSLGKHLRKVRTQPPEDESPAATGEPTMLDNQADPESTPEPDEGAPERD